MDSTPSVTDTSKKSTAAFTEEPALVTSSMEKFTKRKRRVQRVDEILNQRKESSGCKRRRKILGKGARKGYMKGKGGPDNLGCKYKGVRQRKCGKWVAEIRQPDGGPRVWLGTFDNAYNAALAFDEAALAMYGSYAQLNIPETLNPPQSSLIEIDLNLPVALNSDESSFVSSSAMTNPVMRS